MEPLPEEFTLEPVEEAVRLWEGASEALERAGDGLAALCEALDLGIRAVEVLACHHLRTVRGNFPATIGMRLEPPDPAVVPDRDAAEAPPVLRFVDALDLLSADGEPCASPSLHSGWEDRRFSCLRSRANARKACGLSLQGEDRRRLILLAAYRERIFRLPPPVRIRPREILEAFPSLRALYRALAPTGESPSSP